MNHDKDTRQVNIGFLSAAEVWQGCNWTTSFGPRGLNLNGLKARQTRMLAEATSGQESETWAAATHWLEQVERDARSARSAASTAVELFAQQRWAAALAHADTACKLESQYHEQLVWGSLRDLLAAAAEQADREHAL